MQNLSEMLFVLSLVLPPAAIAGAVLAALAASSVYSRAHGTSQRSPAERGH